MKYTERQIAQMRESYRDGSSPPSEAYVLGAHDAQGRGIMQAWTFTCGLRHQGVLTAAVRGCDTLPKHAAAKTMSRFYRGTVLNAHCGDVKGAKTFMSLPESKAEFDATVALFFDEHDALPFHYVLHLMHAAEIVGYYREDEYGEMWKSFYLRLCKRMHIVAETKEQLDTRLNKDENSFFAEQKQ